jgi:hypothetical protein
MEKIMWTSFFCKVFRRIYGENELSERFECFLNEDLAEDFIRKTGIYPNKTREKVLLSPISMSYEPGKIHAGVTVTNLTIRTTIRWGYGDDMMVFSTSEDEIDYKNAKIWFEELDTKKVLELYHKKPKLGFSTANFNTPVEVDFFYHESAYISFYLSNMSDEELIWATIDRFVSSWNEKSEANDRKYGLIHNYRPVKTEKADDLQFYIDLGSAGTLGLKHLFKELDKLEGIQKIGITSFPGSK